MEKEKVIIDVYTTEDGYQIYRVCEWRPKSKGFQQYQANVCIDSGFFYDEGALNDFLEEHKDEIYIVEDYR